MGRGLRQGFIIYRITIGQPTISQSIIRRSHSTRESLTPSPMRSHFDLVDCKEVQRTNRTMASEGRPTMRNSKRYGYDQPWRLPYDSQVSAKVVPSHPYLTAAALLHLLLRLNITMGLRSSKQPQPTRHINNTLTNTNYHDQAIIMTLPNTKTAKFLSRTTLTHHIHHMLTKLPKPDSLLKLLNPRHSMSMAKTSTWTIYPRRAKMIPIPTPAPNPSLPISPNGLNRLISAIFS